MATVQRTLPAGSTGGRSDRRAALEGIGQMVYAARLPDGVIKIGCTSNFYGRQGAIATVSRVARSDVQIIGFVPGGTFEDEDRYHKRLKPYLHHGKEYYHPVAEVLAAVNEMRAMLNLEPLVA